MASSVRSALVVYGALTALTGLIYPLGVTALAGRAWPERATGSQVRDEGGGVVGSALFGQPFAAPEYFWGRPSATAAAPYDGAASSGSNLGPLNPALREAMAARVRALRASDPGNDAPIPVDLVTTSASGLDPHISPQAARWQVRRVARARGRAEAEIRALVDAAVEPPTWGVWGEPRVEVLRLNRALDGAR